VSCGLLFFLLLVLHVLRRLQRPTSLSFSFLRLMAAAGAGEKEGRRTVWEGN